MTLVALIYVFDKVFLIERRSKAFQIQGNVLTFAFPRSMRVITSGLKSRHIKFNIKLNAYIKIYKPKLINYTIVYDHMKDALLNTI